jgi:hypothetical protein
MTKTLATLAAAETLSSGGTEGAPPIGPFPPPPPNTAGTATIYYYANVGDFGHFSIQVDYGGQSLHTEQLVNLVNNTTSIGIVDPATAATATATLTVPLPNAQTAMAFQRALLGQGPFPPYDRSTNSCTTHVGDVLQAGGYPGVPNEGRRIAVWLKKVAGF